jgi:threonine aldolase
MIDLLSDTVTRPSPAMMRAMAEAPLGDDVYREDPTVDALEQRAAALLGKPASLFTASGTMSNLLAFLVQAERGTKILIGDQSDAWLWEARGASVLGGIAYEPIRTREDGTLALADLTAAMVYDDDDQCAPTAMIALEAPHAGMGGRILPLSYLAKVRALADSRALKVHIDGARLCNAAAASGIEITELTRHCDTVSLCLSKGLAAPVGSILAGDDKTIAQARRLRKMIGGGWRQAGLLAAAGLHAIEHQIPRLVEDHERARRLASAITQCPDLVLEREPEINIVYFRLRERPERTGDFVDALLSQGLRVHELQPGRIRAVTHADISDADIESAVAILRATSIP